MSQRIIPQLKYPILLWEEEMNNILYVRVTLGTREIDKGDLEIYQLLCPQTDVSRDLHRSRSLKRVNQEPGLETKMIAMLTHVAWELISS